MRPDASRYLNSGNSGCRTRHDCEIVRGAKAEQPQAGLDEHTFRYELAMLKLELALIKASLQARRRRWQAKTFNPDQPRVPAGSSDGGQWTDANGNGLSGNVGTNSVGFDAAYVIRICVAIGISRFGDGTYKVIYECFDGRKIERSGVGRAPGLIRDPGW
jgi:hypothetical protein